MRLWDWCVSWGCQSYLFSYFRHVKIKDLISCTYLNLWNLRIESRGERNGIDWSRVAIISNVPRWTQSGAWKTCNGVQEYFLWPGDSWGYRYIYSIIGVAFSDPESSFYSWRSGSGVRCNRYKFCPWKKREVTYLSSSTVWVCIPNPIPSCGVINQMSYLFSCPAVWGIYYMRCWRKRSSNLHDRSQLLRFIYKHSVCTLLPRWTSPAWNSQFLQSKKLMVMVLDQLLIASCFTSSLEKITSSTLKRIANLLLPIWTLWISPYSMQSLTHTCKSACYIPCVAFTQDRDNSGYSWYSRFTTTYFCILHIISRIFLHQIL